jgi:uncharacterized protein (TIGR03032 family)
VNDVVTTAGRFPLSGSAGSGADGKAGGAPVLTADEGFRLALARVQSTVALSAVPSGVFLVGCPDGAAPLHVAHIPLAHAWGLAADSQRLAVATHREIIVFARSSLPSSTHPDRPGYFDAFFTPRVTFFTGECLIHDMAIVRTGLLASNTRFSNVSMVDGRANFDPIWHPYFISAITPEDRCHLNGLAAENGELRYVTAFGPFDEPQGWRSHDLNRGVVLDVARNAILTDGLCLPHSPRLIDGRLFVLEAGTGAVLQVDRDSGKTATVAELPGFVRGLAAAEGVLFVGLSVIRNTAQGVILPVSRSGTELVSGIAAVDAANGAILGMLRFGEDQEVFDLALIPSATRAGISNGAGAGGCYAVDSRAGSYWMSFNGTNTEAGNGQETS